MTLEGTILTPITRFADADRQPSPGGKGRPGHPSLIWKPLLSIAAAGFAVEIPFFIRGTPDGHDLQFHLYSWLEVLSQWKQGIVYPCWAALAHFGYGEPRFVFYPPASWALGAALGAFLPWKMAAVVYVWLALVAAGVSMFLLARLFFDQRDATFAAVLYAINPYQLVIVYWRGALAELLASSLFPLLLLLVLRTDEKRRRIIVLLALLLASAWLINVPAALMIHYSLTLMIVLVAWLRRSPRILVVVPLSVVMGAALAAFYLLPALYEQKWVSIGHAVYARGNSRPVDNFLFTHTANANHNAFNDTISWVATAEIVITGAAAWAARSFRRRYQELWFALLTWAVACTLLMLPFSNKLWEILPQLRFMQHPWRWLLALAVAFTWLIVMGFRRWTSRIAVYFAMLCLLFFLRKHFEHPWWAGVAVLHGIERNIVTGEGYKGTEEYTPAGADPFSISTNAPRITIDGPSHAAILVSEWGAERKDFIAEVSAPDHLALHLFNYPAWRVEVNGHVVQAGRRESTGQMLVPVQAGVSRVKIIFVRTWDHETGKWISGFAMLLSLGLLRKSSPSSA